MSFHSPVYVGDLVSCYARVIRIGRTSMTVQVDTYARRGRTGEEVKVTEGRFTAGRDRRAGASAPGAPGGVRLARFRSLPAKQDMPTSTA